MFFSPRAVRSRCAPARLISTACLAAAMVPALSAPAPEARIAAPDSAFPELRAELMARRDAFIRRATAAGLVCHIPPPKIVLVNIPSFGNYEPETNTLMTPDWSQLDSSGKAIFLRIAGPNATEADARKEFEIGAHHWVYVHELGHWTQTCQHLDGGEDHYAIEYGADRIDAAYWREADPAVVAHMAPVFGGIVLRAPSPVPPGAVKEEYFNENYEKLGPTPAYIWFQADMCVTVFDEQPQPSLAQSLGVGSDKAKQVLAEPGF